MRFKILIVAALAAIVLGCGNPPSQPVSDQEKAQEIAASRANYIPRNDVEGSNYIKRLRRADRPDTILWCTFFPENPNYRAVTVPIVGKLTSGSKRPFPSKVVYDFDYNWGTDPLPAEMPDAQGMYGSSGEYRFGFTPADAYVDFYNLATFCTDMPMIYQRIHTEIMLSVDSRLSNATLRARATLCKSAGGRYEDNECIYPESSETRTPDADALREAYDILSKAIQEETK